MLKNNIKKNLAELRQIFETMSSLVQVLKERIKYIESIMTKS